MGLSSVRILHPKVLDVYLNFRLVIVLFPEVQDLPNRGTFAILLLTHLLSLDFIVLSKGDTD